MGFLECLDICLILSCASSRLLLVVVLVLLLVTVAITICLIQRRLTKIVPRSHIRLLIEEAKYKADVLARSATVS